MSPFSHYLSNLIRASTLSQSDLALILDMDQGHLSKVLNGQKNPLSAAKLLRIVEALNLSPEEFQKLTVLSKYSSKKISIPVQVPPEGYLALHDLSTKATALEAWQFKAIRAILNSVESAGVDMT
jgi:transcriptional regulator with XRE-family HTH domain